MTRTNCRQSLNHYESRLPEIERFRRQAAQKALETGKCQRVEADELNSKSKVGSLGISRSIAVAAPTLILTKPN